MGKEHLPNELSHHIIINSTNLKGSNQNADKTKLLIKLSTSIKDRSLAKNTIQATQACAGLMYKRIQYVTPSSKTISSVFLLQYYITVSKTQSQRTPTP